MGRLQEVLGNGGQERQRNQGGRGKGRGLKKRGKGKGSNMEGGNGKVKKYGFKVLSCRLGRKGKVGGRKKCKRVNEKMM